MFKKTTVSILLAWFVLTAFAQDTVRHATNYYVGVQANQLIRQLFSLSSSSSVIDNPYLLTYAINSATTGAGVNFGLGYTFNEFSDGDAFNERKNKISDFFFRAGYEKKSKFGKHWIISAGVDVVVDRQNNTTRTKDGGGASVTTKNKSNGWGLGPRVTLNYAITDKMLLGTEVTYYFKSVKSTIEISGAGGGLNEDKDESFKRFQLNVPAALFLILKF
jgi:hypothetical protein